MKQPWTPFGIGWLLAVIVAVITVLSLLGAITVGGNIVVVCLLLLALAMLL